MTATTVSAVPTAPATPPATAPRPVHPWLVLIAMTGALSMVMLDQTVVTVALPSMARELPLSASGQQWVVNAYVLAMAALVALGGKLGDKLGGVTTFRLGVILFFLASAGCGLAPHGSLGEPWLLATRGLQGVGAALMMPASAVIVMNAFSVERRGRAMAAYAGISQLFLAVGPLVGGVLTESVSWRAVFWLNVPVGIVALVLVRLARPANVRCSDARINPVSVAVLVVGLGALVLAIQQAASWFWTSQTTLVTLGVGVLLTAVFTATQIRSRHPLVNVRLFSRAGFAGDVVVNFLLQFGMLAVVLFSSLYLQQLLRMSPIATGLAVLPLIVPITIGAQVAGRWYDRAGVRPPVLTGLTIATVGLLAWTVTLPLLSYPVQVPGMALTGLGIGLVISPTNTDGLGRVAPLQRSQASGLLQTMRQLGGTLGVAVISAIVTGTAAGHTGHHASADAITAGFTAATVVFALALVCARRWLSRTQITATS